MHATKPLTPTNVAARHQLAVTLLLRCPEVVHCLPVYLLILVLCCRYHSLRDMRTTGNGDDWR